MKRFICTVLALALAFLLCSCGKQSEPNTSSEAEAQAVTEASDKADEATTAAPRETTLPASTTTAAPLETTRAAAAPDVRTEGSDSIFTTNPENKFIKTVSETYGVNPDFLAALYTESADNNYVWQFDGTYGEDGKPVRTPETLKYVYALDKNCSNLQRTDGESEFLNCPRQTAIVVFEATKQLLIPKFQEYL